MWQLLIYKDINIHPHSTNTVFHLFLAFSRKPSMTRVNNNSDCTLPVTDSVDTFNKNDI